MGNRNISRYFSAVLTDVKNMKWLVVEPKRRIGRRSLWDKPSVTEQNDAKSRIARNRTNFGVSILGHCIHASCILVCFCSFVLSGASICLSHDLSFQSSGRVGQLCHNHKAQTLSIESLDTIDSQLEPMQQSSSAPNLM